MALSLQNSLLTYLGVWIHLPYEGAKHELLEKNLEIWQGIDAHFI